MLLTEILFGQMEDNSYMSHRLDPLDIILDPSQTEWEKIQDNSGYVRGLLFGNGALVIFNNDVHHTMVYNRFMEKLSKFPKPVFKLTFKKGVIIGRPPDQQYLDAMFQRNKFLARYVKATQPDMSQAFKHAFA